MFVWLVQVRGSDGGKGRKTRGSEEEGSLWRRTGWMDGWIARHRDEGGREEEWKEVKERKMVTRNEWEAVCVRLCVFACACANGNILYNFYGLGTGPHPLLTRLHTHRHRHIGAQQVKELNSYFNSYLLYKVH